MENPQISFLTPTVLAGDGSNLDVVAHELSHSWSGNLVTCAGWSHFWLNEGWTVFLERKIVEKLYGRKYAEFSAIIGWKALEDSVSRYGGKHEFTKLIQNLEGVDPDDSFSSVPYEKGYNLLYYLESLLGAESFEKFAFFCMLSKPSRCSHPTPSLITSRFHKVCREVNHILPIQRRPLRILPFSKRSRDSQQSRLARPVLQYRIAAKAKLRHDRRNSMLHARETLDRR